MVNVKLEDEEKSQISMDNGEVLDHLSDEEELQSQQRG